MPAFIVEWLKMKTRFKIIITVCLTAVFAFRNAARVAFDRGMDAKYKAEVG
jgi:hypothetical protein